MKSQNLTHLGAHFCVAVTVAMLAAGVLYGSNFVRGLYSPPPISEDAAWDDLASIGATHIYNQRGTFSSTQLNAYRDLLSSLGLQAILEKGGWYWPSSTPYLVKHYSMGQYKELQVEWDAAAAEYLLNFDGTGYYYFQQFEGDEDNGAWLVDPESDDPGEILKGPFDTAIPSEGYILAWEPQFSFYKLYDYTQRTFRQRVRAMADLTGHDPDELVFEIILDYEHQDRTFEYDVNSLAVTVGDFQQSMQFDTLEFDQTLTTADSVRGFGFRIYWPGTVKLWIDWIAYMDMDQAYPLFADQATQDNTLQAIVGECNSVEAQMGDVLARWMQSDEPQRSSFTPHGVVNEYLQSLGEKWAQCPQYPSANRNFKHFVTVGKVPILEVDQYVFDGVDYGGALGDQSELTALSCSLEVAYQAAQMGSVPFAFTGQAHRLLNMVGGEMKERHRHPCRGEFFAQTYIALAHGASEIYFYPYKSGTSASSESYGLVDLDWSHEEEPFASKWQAVHDIFAQLDSIGGTLLSLQRDTAFCVYDDSTAFLSPITKVYFTDDDTNYIEVGQFDSSGTDFLILVNRRTDYDRHITVETNKTGNWALRDLYTQEQFISSTGNFEAIPFDSGEGRVFRLESLE